MTLEGKKIVLGVCGGIAAYRAVELCSLLLKQGALVRVVMTHSATQFVTPLTFATLSQFPVYTDLFDQPRSYEMEHISWAKWADALVIAPATANVIAKMAAGLADDALTTLYISFAGPVIVAPAMNTHMLRHPTTQENLARLRAHGVHIVPCGVGRLACGDEGEGRLAEPAVILEHIAVVLSGRAPEKPSQFVEISLSPAMPATVEVPLLAGKTVVITSGPTHEYIDPVRFITNPSSGKMGAALAREAARSGAEVHLVTGPVHPSILPEDRVAIHQVTTAEEMLEAVQALADRADVFIFAAAVSDFRVAQPINRKIKRTGNSISLPLIENPDIAAAIGTRKRPNQVTIGFAAETHDLEKHAVEKLRRKRLDAIVANDVTDPNIGFESDENEVTLYLQSGDKRFISRRPKVDVARAVIELAAELLRQKNDESSSQTS